jgi:hypothetical protein
MTAVHQIKSAQQIFCSNPSWAKAAHEHLNAISHPSFTSHVSPHPISQTAAATHPPKQHCSCFSTEATRMQDGNLEARREGFGLFPATERAGEGRSPILLVRAGEQRLRPSAPPPSCPLLLLACVLGASATHASSLLAAAGV